MKTELSFSPLAGIETELLAVLAADTQTEKGPDAKPTPVLLTSDAAVKAAAAAVLASGEFKAGANETVLLHAPAGLKAKRLLIVGLGKRAKATLHSVRNAAGTAVRFTKPRGIRELVFALPEADDSASRGRSTRRRRGRVRRRLRSRHLSQRPQRPQRAILHRRRPCQSRPGRRQGRIRRRRHHRREPELRPRPRQRARQQAHPHRHGPARRGYGQRSRPQGRGLLDRKDHRAQDGRVLERLAGL